MRRAAHHDMYAIDAILTGQPWIKRLRPFPHYLARNVFVPKEYNEFESAFLHLAKKKRQYLPQHDIHGETFTKSLKGPLTFFASRQWHDLIAQLLGIHATGHVNLGVHHHRVQSKSGFPHNDLNPGWFVDYPTTTGIILADPGLCSYTDGRTTNRNISPRELVRAAVLIFYLANPKWSRGDGGETGLYENPHQEPERPYLAVPPINNSLVTFECTPHSFHGFISNRRTVRNSLVMWWHREKSEAVERWGNEAIVEYKI